MKPIVFSSAETAVPEQLVPRRLVFGLVSGLLFMSLATVLHWLLNPFLRNSLSMSALCWAVAVTVWFFGWGPALVSAFFGFFATMSLIDRSAASESAQVTTSSLIYALNCTIIIVLGESARRAMARRMRSQQKLEARVNDLQTLLDILPCGVWIADPAGNTVSGNKEAYALLGLEEPEQSSAEDDRACEKFQYREKGVPIPYEEMPLQKVARSGETIMGFEYEIVFPNTQSRFLFGNAAPLRDHEGFMRGVIAAAIDFTERKRVELELAHHRDHLETMVRERTATLVKSEQLLKRSERLASLGIFASGIAHELNNPLNSILLMTQYLIQKKDQSSVSPETLQKISEEAKRGGQIVKSILKLARNEYSPKAAAELGEVVRHAVSMMRSYVDCSRLDLDLRIHPDLPPVVIDSLEIEQVVMNLIKNAVEASSDPIHIGIDAKLEDQNVVLRVSNDGPRIPTEVCQHIFDPFFTTKRTTGGSGLGLSLCHKIICEHKGSIDVESSEDNGTTFTIRLPVGTSGLKTIRLEAN